MKLAGLQQIIKTPFHSMMGLYYHIIPYYPISLHEQVSFSSIVMLPEGLPGESPGIPPLALGLSDPDRLPGSVFFVLGRVGGRWKCQRSLTRNGNILATL